MTTGQFKRNLEVHGFPMVMEQLEAILNKVGIQTIKLGQ